jgi:formylglycine-generating enzyme required for sulfatase activity
MADGQPVGGAGGRHDFAIDEQEFVERRVSVGLAPPAGISNLSVRIQLFRGDRERLGVPPPGSSLRTTALLPSVAAGDHLELSVTLRTDDVGRAIGEPTPVEAERGPPAASRVGSWPGAKVVPCAAAAPAGQACVPGGAFWFGDPLMRLSPYGLLEVTDERLVAVSPFFIDAEEVTVGAFRTRWASLGGKYQPTVHDASGDPSSAATWCVWSNAPIGLEDRPINCIVNDTAALYCHAVGGDLPTEAQLEFLASGRGRELGYPWGDDEPGCDDAVWGLGRGGGVTSAVANTDDSCRASADLGGSRVAGSGLRDRITLLDPVTQTPTEVLDLAGNLGEWARDRWSQLSEPFWSGAGPLTDPVASLTSADGFLHVIRMGSWTGNAYQLRAGYRAGAPEAVAYDIGFRCVHPAR